MKYESGTTIYPHKQKCAGTLKVCIVLMGLTVLVGHYFTTKEVIIKYENKNRAEVNPKMDLGRVLRVSEVEASEKTNGDISKDDQKIEETKTKIRVAFSKHGDKVVREALKIAECESHFKREAFNAEDPNGGSVGVFQINLIHSYRWGSENIKNWEENIKIAEKIYTEQGWNPWSCKRVL